MNYFKITQNDLYSIIQNKKFNNNIPNTAVLAEMLYRNLASGSIELDEFIRNNRIISELEISEQFFIKKNKEYFGENVLKIERRDSLKNIFIRNIKDKTLLLLFIAAIISYIIFIVNRSNDNKYGWVEGTSILGAIVLIVAIGTLNEYSQSLMFESLEKTKQMNE